jgi:hypothetical protein
VNVGSAGALITFNGNAGTPSALVGTNITGTAAGLTAGNVTTNANLTGVITSVGNATSIASQTGTGTKFVVDTNPTLVTPILGVASATSLQVGNGNSTTPGLNFGTGVGVYRNGNRIWIENGSNFIGFEGMGVYFGTGDDTVLARNAAGVVEVNNGTLGTYRDLLARGLRSNAVTFANAIAAPVEGTLQAFTDSSTNTWGATITGGGANHVLGYFDGTNWTVFAK